MVSYFDHETGMVPRPTILLDKQTGDAHDNPVISIDRDGIVWVFSTSHGLSRPSYIHRSVNPYDVSDFQMVPAVNQEAEKEQPLDNFSYLQMHYDKDHGFLALLTKYHYPANRTGCFMSSADGIHWTAINRIAAIEKGHYQLSTFKDGKLAVFSNMHPKAFQDNEKHNGLDWRTNLYYMESLDFGKSWQSVDGKKLEVPLTDVKNDALVFDFESEGLLQYVKDIQLDAKAHPVITYLTSKHSAAGPQYGKRTLMLSRWDGSAWSKQPITTTDHNYDSLSLYLESDDLWRVIAATEPGPQPFGTGGEMVMWTSKDQGANWHKERELTVGSKYNHSYARRPVNAHPGFYAFWADGNARAPSKSSLYFCNQKGDVFKLPRSMGGNFAAPTPVSIKASK
jgi:hypothetical protein